MPVREPQPAARPASAAALQRTVRRLSRAAQAPWLHAEVARRMAERLALIRREPNTVLDWCSFAGGGAALLRQAYPRASIVPVEPDVERRAGTARRRWWRRAQRALAPQEVTTGKAGLVWANMVLHWADDPTALLQRWSDALHADGFVMYSTLGPGSLRALADLYAHCGWPPPFAPFVDMHDLGDMMLHAGLADPVMDQEALTLTWPDAVALLREMRSLGGNADPDRFAGLRTPRWCERLQHALGALAGADGRLRLTFEIVYGHAFRAAPRVAASTRVGLDEMRAMVRAGRSGIGEAGTLR